MKDLSHYGIIDLAFPWPLPRNSKIYKTEIDQDLSNVINEFGFEKASYYIQEQDQRKFLIERDLNNICLILFPSGSGGHFLANCLTLNNDIIMFNYSEPQDRCNWICSKYDEEGKYWNDINLVNQIENQSKHIFRLSHPEEGCVKELWNFWSKSDKIIIFKNTLLFCILRKCVVAPVGYYLDKDGYYKLKHIVVEQEEGLNKVTIRDHKFSRLDKILKKHNINLSNYKNLPLNTKIEIQKLFNDKKSTMQQNYSHCKLKDKKQYYFWDCNWFLDEDEFLFNLQKLYYSLDLNKFDKKMISACYNSWMDAMCRSLEKNYGKV